MCIKRKIQLYFRRCKKNPGDAHDRMSPARNKVHGYNRGGV